MPHLQKQELEQVPFFFRPTQNFVLVSVKNKTILQLDAIQKLKAGSYI